MDFFKIGKNIIKPVYVTKPKQSIILDVPTSLVPFGLESDGYKKILKINIDSNSKFYREIKKIEECIFELPITHTQLLSQFTSDPSNLGFKSNIRESEKYPPLLTIRIPSKSNSYEIRDQLGDLISFYRLPSKFRMQGTIKVTNVWVRDDTYGYTLEIDKISLID